MIEFIGALLGGFTGVMLAFGVISHLIKKEEKKLVDTKVFDGKIVTLIYED